MGWTTSASPTSLATVRSLALLSPATRAAGPTAELVVHPGFSLPAKPQVLTPDRQLTTQRARDLATISILRQAICLVTTPCWKVKLSSLKRKSVSSSISTCGEAALVRFFEKSKIQFLSQGLMMRNCLQPVTTK